MERVTGPTVEQIVDVVVRLLALERGQEEAEVRAELEEGGWELPIDSLRIVEILTRLEEELGVEIPADVDSARAMRSVRAFAEIVRDAVVTGDRSA
ncbi:acyl carrier protein [Krasilnikovia sp. MM14-A1259]|uniref:acyl carrier protein n=1 Tax=Krasilnikovia sp. MM14-A1259 TaxID=3373539 RepID=UPI00399C9415